MPLPLPPASIPPDVDLFCRVIDNYGDIGVCWRLARRLAHEKHQRVRLWVDDLSSFSRLEPGIVNTPQQYHRGIEVRYWHANVVWPVPAACVIEAFGCDLPEAYIAQLGPAHRWVNLEYLSAETWVESCHGMPSPQSGGITKQFFFPGFSASTGGLLREATLLARRDRWQADPQQRQTLWQELGLSPNLAASAAAGHHRVALLFCYPGAPVAALLQALQHGALPWVILLAGGSGANLAQERLTGLVVHSLPFVDQDTFDKLLWSSDLNLVRGEDSFVRAQWAARPFLWHIYPQQDGSHQAKLNAWLSRAAVPGFWRTLLQHWNHDQPGTITSGNLAALTAHNKQAIIQTWSRNWADKLAQLPELADSLLA